MATCMVVIFSSCGKWQGIGKCHKYGRCGQSLGLIGKTSPQNWLVCFLKGECRTVGWWWFHSNYTLIHKPRQTTATWGLSKSVFARVILSKTFVEADIAVQCLPQVRFAFQASITPFKQYSRRIACTVFIYFTNIPVWLLKLFKVTAVTSTTLSIREMNNRTALMRVASSQSVIAI